MGRVDDHIRASSWIWLERRSVRCMTLIGSTSLPFNEVLIDVLGNDNSQVRDFADGDRDPGQRHDVGVDLKPLHADERHQHGHRQRDRHDEARAKMQQEQHNDDGRDDQFFAQRFGKRGNGFVDQSRPVVDGYDL